MNFFIKKNIKIKKFSYFINKDNKIFNVKINKKNYKIYIIKNVLLAQIGDQNLAVLKDNYLVDELSFQSKNLIRKSIKFNKILKKNLFFFKKKKITGSSLSLLQDVSQKRNYFHFLYDSFTRLHIVNQLKKIKFDNILIPSLEYKFQKEILHEFNSKKNLINCNKTKLIYLEKLIIIDHPYWVINKSWNTSSKEIPKWSVDFIKKTFKKFNKKNKFKKKIFIDRTDTKSIYGQIDNIDELKKFLKNKGFDCLKLTSLSFKDQITLFKNAKIIVSPHGAGLTNLTFCKPKTKIIKFSQKEHNVFCFDNIVKFNNLKITNLKCKTRNNKILVNLKNLNKFIN